MNKVYIAAIAALLGLTACGGGGGGTNNTDDGGGNGDTGGIDGRGTPVAVQGSITGFGSVIVNGVQYDTEGAEFEIDGEIGSQDDLAIGDIVVLAGTISDDGVSGTATKVTFDDLVEGPVTAKDTNLGRLTVLGQTVEVTGETSFDDGISPASLDGISIDDIVEVSGYRLANGIIRATRIEDKPAGLEFEVTGTAENVSGMTFTIADLTVDFSGASLDDNFPGVTVEDGQLVEAKGTTFANGELEATRVEYKGNLLGANPGDHVELEGFITSFDSVENFEVNGLPVMTTGQTVFEGVGTLNVNLKVEVEGEYNDANILVADKVEIKAATAVRVVGLVNSIPDETAEPPVPLEVYGIEINANDLKTRFDDKAGDTPLDNMKLADLMVGDYVEVRGQEQPQGQITAVIVERDDIDDRRELRGFVETGGKNEPNLIVLGVTIVTDGQTVYRDSRGDTEVVMTPGEFWLAVQEGSLVDARGTETDTKTLTATEVELQGD